MGFGDISSGFAAPKEGGGSSGFGGASGFGGGASEGKTGFGAAKSFGGNEGESKGFGSGGNAGFGSSGNTGFGSGGNTGFGSGGGFGETGEKSGFGGGGGFGGQGGATGERPRGCFNCGEEGHRSADCTQPRKSRGCFNCGQEGHRSNDCPEPRKPRDGAGRGAGGGGFGGGAGSGFGGQGGERPRGCFNCGEEGHRSNECPQPRKPREGGGGGARGGSGFGGGAAATGGFGGSGFGASGGGSGFGGGATGGSGFGGGGAGERPRGCFNCGEQGHRSNECSQPRKPREGGGAGGGGSGFGGGATGGSGFGGSGFGASSGGSGFGGGAGGGSGFGGGGGTGERPRGCFNCGEEGHRSNECPQPRKPREGGPPRGCFNCGQEGHRSNECPEPKKPREQGSGFGGSGFGGGGAGFGSGGGLFGAQTTAGNERPRGCFNCGQEGHRSTECPQPRKSRDDMDPSSKPASTYVPVEVPDEELFKFRITEGDRFKEFFEADVNVTSSGKKIKISPINTFDELELPPQVKANVREAGYNKPTPIQQHAMAIIKNKMDLMACAQTGSGKTAAFLLPIIKDLIVNDDMACAGSGSASPRCVIVAPTRELADQISREGQKFLRGTVLKIASVYGGTQVGAAKARLAMGPSIVVGTMGRLLHFIKDGTISMDEVRYIVLDEADRMLETSSFADDVRKMISLGPSKEKRTTLMFSATFPDEVQQLASEHLKSDHAQLAVDKIGSANRCITQEFIEVSSRQGKRDKLLELLNVDVNNYTVKDQSMFEKKTIVFVNRKAFADQLGLTLSEAGLPAVTMHGDREQRQRSEALSEFRSGSKPVLIATAVAERGLDIQGVDHVINYDLPQCKEDYVHRIGRTGRVGNPGRATSFFDPSDSNDMNLSAALVGILAEAHQIVPDFLQSALGTAGFSVNAQAAPSGGADADETDW
ncbi:unnamed protein product, partial [Mesorhabditis belari]|uniref:RNA helicase n=1 Tax=Mesorhabditis belari TaxID=2138241 RepID=A0AAF3EWN5_9BILA